MRVDHMQLFVRAFATICLILLMSSANAVEVNGKLKDECKFLLQAIEKNVSYVNRQTNGGNYEAGTYLYKLKLSELIKVYKDLCE